MAFWFYRGLRRGIATTRYPKAFDAWANALPSAPAFHSDQLTLALVDRLVGACPSSALSRSQRELVIDLGRCTGCQHCLEVAQGAARPSGVSLLATGDRATLVKRVPIRGVEEGFE